MDNNVNMTIQLRVGGLKCESNKLLSLNFTGHTGKLVYINSRYFHKATNTPEGYSANKLSPEVSSYVSFSLFSRNAMLTTS